MLWVVLIVGGGFSFLLLVVLVVSYGWVLLLSASGFGLFAIAFGCCQWF